MCIPLQLYYCISLSILIVPIYADMLVGIESTVTAKITTKRSQTSTSKLSTFASVKKKKKSGWEFEKQREERKKADEKSAKQLLMFLKPKLAESAGERADSEKLAEGEVRKADTSHTEMSSKDEGTSTNQCSSTSSYSECEREPATSTSAPEGNVHDDGMGCVDSVPKTETIINFDEPRSWPPIITERIRCTLIEHGMRPIDRIIDEEEFSKSEKSGRKFDPSWFYKILPNGEKCARDWLLYGSESKALYCFPCIIFPTNRTTSGLSSLVDKTTGFTDWKHLNPTIPKHENSEDHIKNYVKWKGLLSGRNLIDSKLISHIRREQDRWREILKALLDIIMFCAQNNMPLRGHREVIGQSGSGVFLGLCKLISHYYPAMATHLERCKNNPHSTNYLSHDIQNEFISLLGSSVKQEIIKEIEKAKYYAILFDCTPDISHKEQMCQIIRYVEITGSEVKIVECFIDFIQIEKKKSGANLAEYIVKKLKADGIDLQNCRGQSYDNANTMRGEYRGVQKRIKDVSEHAKFVPCSAHSLNLVGVHAASAEVGMVTFFGTVQNLFTFFSTSTTRWDVLVKHLNTSLKRHSDTRWSSKYESVHVLSAKLENVLETLQEIIDDSDSSPESISGATALMHQIDFHFICRLVMWDEILNLIDKVNKSLQKVNITLDVAEKMLEGLLTSFKELRIRESAHVFFKATEMAENLGIEAQFASKRRRYKKRQFSYEGRGDILSPEAEFNKQFLHVIDSVIMEITDRYDALKEINSFFSFLNGRQLLNLDNDNLKARVDVLAAEYPSDIDADALLCEVKSFRGQIKSLIDLDLKNLIKKEAEEYNPFDFLKLIHAVGVRDVYPNLEIILRIFASIPVTTATAERSFSKLKIIKTYLRSTMGQLRLSSLAILSIEKDIADKVDFNKIIDKFAVAKSRKVQLI